MKASAFYCLFSHLSGSLTMNKSLWLRWKSSKLCNTSNCNQIWIHIHLAPCLPFQSQHCPSKRITTCNQSSKSIISTFYAEFRNSLLVLVQLFIWTSKGHKLPQLSSLSIVLVPGHTSSNSRVLPGEYASSDISFPPSSWFSSTSVTPPPNFQYRFCDFNCICISYRKWCLKYDVMVWTGLNLFWRNNDT